jgi:dimethylhistidine N-methyltransferase
MPDPNSSQLLREFARDVRQGLRSEPKFLLAKYFYDESGSRLFEEITRLPEYYLTRTEASILKEHAAAIRDALDGDISLVELGSGSSSKTQILLENIMEEQRRLHYLPIDISPTILDETARKLDARYPRLTIIPIASEYGEGLRQATRLAIREPQVADRKLVLFLGSSIGNFEPSEAGAFLKTLRDGVGENDALLIGFDLQKDRRILEPAYDDAAGVTARFNLNVLARINRELGGEFDLNSFRHRAFYNEDAGRIEMHLVSQKEQQVAVRRLEESFGFAKGESIHTESSYKYTIPLIEDIAGNACFKVGRVFTDPKNWYALALFFPIII